MACLSGTYAASILIQQNGDDVQLFLGTVAVLETVR
jgi:hypothetical protein